MPFRTSLDALLRVRRGLERQQELLLQAATGRVASLQQELMTIQTQIEDDAARELQQMQSGLTAAELHFDLLCRSALRARHQQVESRFMQAWAQRNTQAQSFRVARQQREILETLREQQLAAYRRQSDRQDQRRLDDAFLLRRAYLSRS